MREMLECVSSYEISEWMAYERAFGSLGPEYRDRALAAIHGQLRQIALMYAQVNSDGDFDPDDIPAIPLPDEIHGLVDDDEEDEEEYIEEED